MTSSHFMMTPSPNDHHPLPSIKRDCCVSHCAFIKFHFASAHNESTTSSLKTFFVRRPPALSQGCEWAIFYWHKQWKGTIEQLFPCPCPFLPYTFLSQVITCMPHWFVTFEPLSFVLVHFCLHCSTISLPFSPFGFSYVSGRFSNRASKSHKDVRPTVLPAMSPKPWMDASFLCVHIHGQSN